MTRLIASAQCRQFWDCCPTDPAQRATGAPQICSGEVYLRRLGTGPRA
jgi:hypothetical protein